MSEASVKLLSRGVETLTDQELLELLLDDGDSERLAGALLSSFEGRLAALGYADIARLRMAAGSEPGTYDVILMDVMMPVMDGLTAARTIRALDRQDAKTIPIIAMTANAFREDAERCMEAGMNAHLAKPLDDEKIKQTISEELRKQNACHE